jgi:hypothetical protein
MLDEKVPDKAALQLAGSFFYKVPPGAWRIATSCFHPSVGDRCAYEISVAVRMLYCASFRTH